MRRTLWRRPSTIVLTMAAFVAVAFLARPKSVDVDIQKVTRGPLVATIDEEGRATVRSRFTLSAPVGGSVQRIEVEEGDRIEAGAVAARIAPAAPSPLDERTRAQLASRLEAAEDALQRARAAVVAAQAEFEYAAAESTRAERLGGVGALSRGDVELAASRRTSSESTLRAAEAAARAAAHERDEARAAMLTGSPRGYSGPLVDVRAPVSATVLRVLEESERVVLPGTPLVEIGNSSDLEVVVDLLSSDAVRVEPGARVLLENWGGDAPLNGRIRLVEPASFMKVSALGVEEQRVNVFIALTDPPEAWRRLGDGYAVDVRIVTGERRSAVKVSSGALFREAEGWAVYAVESGRARLTPVTPGLRAGYEVEIVDGLSEGQEVVVHPGEAVEEGVSVRAR